MKQQLFDMIKEHARDFFELFSEMCWLSVVCFFAALTMFCCVKFAAPIKSDEDKK